MDDNRFDDLARTLVAGLPPLCSAVVPNLALMPAASYLAPLTGRRTSEMMRRLPAPGRDDRTRRETRV